MKIVILEDNKTELTLIKKALTKWVQDYDIMLNIIEYASGEDYFLNPSNIDLSVDLFLLDIEMGQINGIDVAKKLRSLNYSGDIIFLTAFKDFVFDGYNVHAFNYLVKPLDEEVFFKCLTEIEGKRHANCYILRNKQTTISIPHSDIISFSVHRHYVDIATTSELYEQYINLNSLIDILPKQFVQVSRSCIINLAHLQKLSQGKLYLSNGCTVDMGRAYIKDFKTQYFQYTTRFDKNGSF